MKLFRFVLVIALVALLGGCAKYTGGGWIISDDGLGKANFGFVADSCDGDVTGVFNYHDKNAGVKIKGDLFHAFEKWGWSCVMFEYRSTNPKDRGTGMGKVCVKDRGEGANANDDKIYVEIWGGPNAPTFAPYEHFGFVHGNIQEHECELPDF